MFAGIIVDFIEIVLQVIGAFGPVFGPILFAVVIIVLSRKHFVLAFLGTSVLSSVINIICWIFPNSTTGLATGNQLLSLATIQNAIDLVIYAEMSSWGIGADILIVVLGGLSIFLYTKFIFN